VLQVLELLDPFRSLFSLELSFCKSTEQGRTFLPRPDRVDDDDADGAVDANLSGSPWRSLTWLEKASNLTTMPQLSQTAISSSSWRFKKSAFIHSANSPYQLNGALPPTRWHYQSQVYVVVFLNTYQNNFLKERQLLTGIDAAIKHSVYG
jgi:hypothetical protein